MGDDATTIDDANGVAGFVPSRDFDNEPTVEREPVIGLRRPERKTAVLMNDKGQLTKHVYTRTELAKVDRAGKAYAFIFRCTETGRERRWGLEA